jgi:hypothetical protein
MGTEATRVRLKVRLASGETLEREGGVASCAAITILKVREFMKGVVPPGERFEVLAEAYQPRLGRWLRVGGLIPWRLYLNEDGVAKVDRSSPNAPP